MPAERSDLLVHFGGVVEDFILLGWFGWSNGWTDTSWQNPAGLKQTHTHMWVLIVMIAARAIFRPGGVVRTQQQVEGTA